MRPACNTINWIHRYAQIAGIGNRLGCDNFFCEVRMLLPQYSVFERPMPSHEIIIFFFRLHLS